MLKIPRRWIAFLLMSSILIQSLPAFGGGEFFRYHDASLVSAPVPEQALQERLLSSEQSGRVMETTEHVRLNWTRLLASFHRSPELVNASRSNGMDEALKIAERMPKGFKRLETWAKLAAEFQRKGDPVTALNLLRRVLVESKSQSFAAFDNDGELDQLYLTTAVLYKSLNAEDGVFETFDAYYERCCSTSKTMEWFDPLASIQGNHQLRFGAMSEFAILLGQSTNQPEAEKRLRQLEARAKRLQDEYRYDAGSHRLALIASLQILAETTISLFQFHKSALLLDDFNRNTNIHFLEPSLKSYCEFIRNIVVSNFEPPEFRQGIVRTSIRSFLLKQMDRAELPLAHLEATVAASETGNIGRAELYFRRFYVSLSQLLRSPGFRSTGNATEWAARWTQRFSVLANLPSAPELLARFWDDENTRSPMYTFDEYFRGGPDLIPAHRRAHHLLKIAPWFVRAAKQLPNPAERRSILSNMFDTIDFIPSHSAKMYLILAEGYIQLHDYAVALDLLEYAFEFIQMENHKSGVKRPLDDEPGRTRHPTFIYLRLDAMAREMFHGTLRDRNGIQDDFLSVIAQLYAGVENRPPSLASRHAA